MKVFLKTTCLLSLLSLQIIAQSAEDMNCLFSPEELRAIIEKSTITYSFEKFDRDEFEEPLYETFPVPIKINWTDDHFDVDFWDANEIAEAFLDSADLYYKKGEYEATIPFYKKAMSADPENSYVITFLGSIYYVLKDYEKAIEYYKLALEKNYYDYRAHWYLSDVYEKLSKDEEAINEAAIAHILNRNHERIKDELISKLESQGKIWKEFNYDPRYIIIQDSVSKNVTIKANDGWLNYAIAEAVWNYEPGFEAKCSGYEYNEKLGIDGIEFVSFYANKNSEKNKPFMEVLKKSDSMIDLIIYEIYLRKVPYFIYAFDKEKILTLVEYIKKYHLE